MTKYLATLLLFCSFPLLSKAQVPVPPAVQEGFTRQYPEYQVYKWDHRKKRNEWEAKFSIDGRRQEAYFTPDGNWQRTEQNIKADELPRSVVDAMKTAGLPDWKVLDIELHRTPKHEAVYEIQAERKRQQRYFYFLPDGTTAEPTVPREK
jgi:hypothetical protein